MAGPSKNLETFPNPSPDRDYEIAFDVPEFTCLCPLTGQPDFAHFKIRHEAVTNRIRDDLVAALAPRSLSVVGDWFIRGGIKTVVTVSYEKPGRG